MASWTLELRAGAKSLEQAAEAAGLWPAAAPDEQAASLTVPLIRRAIHARSGETHTMTASVRGGLFISLGMFGEEPDWI